MKMVFEKSARWSLLWMLSTLAEKPQPTYINIPIVSSLISGKVKSEPTDEECEEEVEEGHSK